jgi:glycosyltransferase involved in cell wall biosynthesis
VQPRVLYSAAHAEFPDTEPLGGGKAVADYLIREWPGPLTVLSPARFGLAGKLADMGMLRYARFCRQFERAATSEILRYDPRQCVVLSNDISEGPDFSALGERGYKVVTIFHVDVVEFFTKFYLRGVVRPETAAKLYRWPWLPDVLRLVFQKQRDCVRCSARIVVPSSPMREMIVRCYPGCDGEKIVVLPWGDVSARSESAPYPAADDEFVIMTLSRLSPEKGIERLLAALPLVTGKVRVWICGAPAYMRGRRYERRLRRMADGRVEFLGHVTGAEKTALLHRADLFISPSRHESYGLTIAEALAAGCRVISHPHYGASGRVVDCSNPRALAEAIGEMVTAGRTRKNLQGRSTQMDAPSGAAEQLADLLSAIGHDRVAPQARSEKACFGDGKVLDNRM